MEDRCPHLGFPLHRGSVEAGLLTCHWHHARFDLASGCALDLFADDATAFDVALVDGRVVVSPRPQPDPVAALEGRLRDGLEDGLDLVMAKSVLGSSRPGSSAAPPAVRRGSAGMTVLVAMANLVPHLHPDDVPLALVHGLSFVAGDTRGGRPSSRCAPWPTAAPIPSA